MCAFTRSTYSTRPICYPKNFCPLDSVNEQWESGKDLSAELVVCKPKCPANKEITFFEEDVN